MLAGCAWLVALELYGVPGSAVTPVEAAVTQFLAARPVANRLPLPADLVVEQSSGEVAGTTGPAVEAQAVAAVEPPPATAGETAQEASDEPVYHTVAAGESPLSIALQYGITAEALMIANNIIDPTGLQIGQQLLIPPDKGSPLGVRTVVHAIAGGDTLLGLAARYGSTLEDIIATNPDLEPTALQVGQPIVIPLTQPGRTTGASQAVAAPTTPRITEPSAAAPGLAGMEQEMFNAINAERQAQGLPPYAGDEQLTLTARAHAQDMVARGYFSHVTPEGLTVRDRLNGRGIQRNWVGENIIRSVRPAGETVPYAIDWFMNDRPHRANILHSNYTRVGVGVAEGPAGWYTLVLVFAGDK